MSSSDLIIFSFSLDNIKNIMPNKTYFHETWLSDSRFVGWIARSVSKETAHCKLCECDISLSNMGEKALQSHAAGKKHKKRVEDREQVG